MAIEITSPSANESLLEWVAVGPLGSPASRLGVQLTDSAYAAVSMGEMTRMGTPALERRLS
jgi:GTP-dependent phosphoenolpyruvate carboxykinase